MKKHSRFRDSSAWKNQGREQAPMRSQMNNRVTEVPIDRLSNLPDSLIIHILSFLSVQEASVTCALSKRWKFFWSNLPTLQLYESEYNNFNPQKTPLFVAWVNRILDVRTTNSIHEFSLTFFYSEPYEADIDEWIRYAVENRVKKLILKMHARSEDEDYMLPDEIYSTSSLEFLFLQGRIEMCTLEKINWNSLTELCLDGVDLDQDLIDGIFTGCPVLHKFELKRCFGYSRLEVKSPSLRILVLKDRELEDMSPLEVSAPYIHFLYISFCFGGRMVKIGDIQSLCKARIRFNLHHMTAFASLTDEVVMSYTKELFQQAEELELTRTCFEVISKDCRTGLQLPQTRLRCLNISSFTIDDCNIFGILTLLESSPDLEKLVVKGYNTYDDYELSDPAVKNDLDRDLSRLKTVYIIDFLNQHGEPALTLARILLKRAPALEYMEIVINVKESGDCKRVYEELPLFSRANIKAKIVIKQI